MERVEFLRVLRAEHPVVFEAVYRFMLGSVILEERFYVVHLPDRRDVRHEHHDPQQAFNEVEHEGALHPFAQEVHHPGRQDYEENDGYGHREEQGSHHQEIPRCSLAVLLVDPRLELSLLLAILFRSIFLEDVGGFHQSAHSSDERVRERHDAPNKRDLCGAALFRFLLCLKIKLARRQAHRKRDPVRALHHYAFHNSLSADRSRAGLLNENFTVVDFSHLHFFSNSYNSLAPMAQADAGSISAQPFQGALRDMFPFVKATGSGLIICVSPA